MKAQDRHVHFGMVVKPATGIGEADQRPPRNQKIRTGLDSAGIFSVALVASSATR
jgi:hypothetical protein